MLNVIKYVIYYIKHVQFSKYVTIGNIKNMCAQGRSERNRSFQKETRIQFTFRMKTDRNRLPQDGSGLSRRWYRSVQYQSLRNLIPIILRGNNSVTFAWNKVAERRDNSRVTTDTRLSQLVALACLVPWLGLIYRAHAGLL